LLKKFLHSAWRAVDASTIARFLVFFIETSLFFAVSEEGVTGAFGSRSSTSDDAEEFKLLERLEFDERVGIFAAACPTTSGGESDASEEIEKTIEQN
jgi:hypothetical protein